MVQRLKFYMIEENNLSQCPKCKSNKMINETKSEYTGGGYADSWLEFECQECGWIWRSEKKHGYI